MLADLGAIKDRLTIDDVLGACGIEPADRQPCPVHHGENRSAFSVTRNRRFAQCWSCGFKGDVIDLAAALRKSTKGQAIRWCAERAGVGPRGERKPWLEREAARALLAGKVALLRQRQHRDARFWDAVYRDRDATVGLREAGAVLRECMGGPHEEAAWGVLEAVVTARDRAAVDVDEVVDEYREAR